MNQLFFFSAKRTFFFFLKGLSFFTFLIIYNQGLADSPHLKISQYIESESSIIEESASIEDKLIGYLSRGDSYLIQEDYKRAFEDYHEVYCLTGLLSQEDQSFYLFWSLVGEAISLSNQEEYVLADNRISELEYLLRTISWNYNSFPIPPTPPICGPNVVSAKWCKECASGLATDSLNYINHVKDPFVKQQLLDIIRFLYTQAENCCNLSGLDPTNYNWKDCLGPLNAKRWLWKQKWLLYKIPPHPSD